MMKGESFGRLLAGAACLALIGWMEVAGASDCILSISGQFFVPTGELYQDLPVWQRVNRETGAVDDPPFIFHRMGNRWRTAASFDAVSKHVTPTNVPETNCPSGVHLALYGGPPIGYVMKVEAPVYTACNGNTGKLPDGSYTKISETSKGVYDCAKKALEADPLTTAVYARDQGDGGCFASQDPNIETEESDSDRDAACILGAFPIPASGNSSDKVGDFESMDQCVGAVWFGHGAGHGVHYNGNGECFKETEPFELTALPNGLNRWTFLTSGLDITSTTTSTTTSTVTTTTTSTVTTTLTSTVTSTTTLPFCDYSSVNLELFYVQELSAQYCGEDVCAVWDGVNEEGVHEADERIKKQNSIRSKMMPMFNELAASFASFKVGYMEFIDKDMEPFGQEGADFCHKFVNSLVPYDEAYRSYIEAHWANTWSHSGSGRDMLENQLDAAITAAMKGDWSTADFDNDGRMNLRVMFMITDKGFHQRGDVRAEVGAVQCALQRCKDYVPGDACKCVGYEYPTVEQTIDALVQHKVNPFFYLGADVDHEVLASYENIGVALTGRDARLQSAVSTHQGSVNGFNIHEFDALKFRSTLDDLCIAVGHAMKAGHKMTA